MRCRHKFLGGLGFALFFLGCNHRGGAPDLAVTDAGWPDLATSCSDGNGCTPGERCYLGACIPDQGSCRVDDECQNDSWCGCGGTDGGCFCVPWGEPPRVHADPSCSSGFPADQYLPPSQRYFVEKRLPGVIATPVVADLDGDGQPEIIYYYAGLTALHGADLSLVFFRPEWVVEGWVAVGDLDADSIPEIVTCCDLHGHPVVFDNQGNRLADISTNVFNPNTGAPAIADVDGDGKAEIIGVDEVLRYQKGNPRLQILWQKTQPLPFWPYESVAIAADLDGDQRPELIAGAAIYDGATGLDRTPAKLAALPGSGAYAAVGDFNSDGKPDLVLVSDINGHEQVAVYDYAHDKFLFGPLKRQILYGGPPTVADYDGDGQPEFAISTLGTLDVFDLECAVQNPPAKCSQADFGILWEKPIYDNSGVLGSSAFDFDGDGVAEVVHRDMCWLRVYNGRDGHVLFAAPVSSWTGFELPAIADVDGDGHAEIIVSTDDQSTGSPMERCSGAPEADTGTPWTGPTHGILIFADPFRRWMPARPVWNQHSYHGTNIGDDLSVPKVETPSWTATNTYRGQSSPGGRVALPDFTASKTIGIDPGSADCATAWTLRAALCNRGAVAAAAPVPGTFYASDPRQPNPTALCTASTKMALLPGQCETVSCNWKSPPKPTADLWFRADDDGSGKSPIVECKVGNDLLFLPGATCLASNNQ